MVQETRGRAFGAPGIEPRWTRGAKDGVGTAYSEGSTVWYTIARGVLTEIYYPTIDMPQTRDIGFLVTDGESFVHDEKRHLDHTMEKLHPDALGFVVTNSDPEGRYRLVKEIIGDPHAAVVLVRVRLEAGPRGDEDFMAKLHLYVLAAPHLGGDGRGDSAFVRDYAGRPVLSAFDEDDGTWMMIGANAPLLKRSVGYVGFSDGWQDIMTHRRMEWEFSEAPLGNIALTAEIDLSRKREFTLGIAFGDSDHRAASTLFQSLGTRYNADHRPRFIRQWQRSATGILPLEEQSGDGGKLYRTSHALLLAHEDKSYPGALIASTSIPWGEVKGDEDLGGYHLVWTRDMCNSSSALLASDDRTTPLRSLIYLACTQRPDGGFYQNFWIDGRPYWKGIQLDEVSFPIVLAWRLHSLQALGNYDPYPMVLDAAAYVINQGPYTMQERWEENSGYSPSTLAANIAGLVCAAELALERGDTASAHFILDYADFLESHVEAWTVTTQGELLPGVPRHFIRIHPIDPHSPECCEDPNQGILGIKNVPPGERWEWPAKDVVDAGFLELVRYGIRRGGDPLFEDSLRVIDAQLKIDTPAGPVWRRYNHDGYGESVLGEPFKGYGVGRAWPLLAGERAHYELAAGRDIEPFVQTLERFASEIGLLPEQVWDEADRPRQFLFRGRPTGAAMPLMWAHAEYIKLLRSRRDGRVFDLIPPVAERYLEKRGRRDLEVWKWNRRVTRIEAGKTLRILAEAPFRLHVSTDGWASARDLDSTARLKSHYVDVATAPGARAPVQFTFYWTEAARWEGSDLRVDLDPPAARPSAPVRPAARPEERP